MVANGGFRVLTAAAGALLVLTACTAGSAASESSVSSPSATPSSTVAELSQSSADAATTSAAPRGVTQSVVSLAPGVADEASGIAVATLTADTYFLIDDGTGTDEVVPVGGDGTVRARIAVDGMSADNAEALASGTCGPLPPPGGSGASCLYVGDIGDNEERREDIAIYRFVEPDLSDPPDGPVAADDWRYTYPDGPHNAEALLLAPDGSLLVLTKPGDDDRPHLMYRAEPGGGELVLIREFRPPETDRSWLTLVTGNVVTDAVATPGRVLLLTYDAAHEYVAPDPAADPSAFPDWPQRRLEMPRLIQAEGIAGATDGCGYAVASEAGPGGASGALAVMTCQ